MSILAIVGSLLLLAAYVAFAGRRDRAIERVFAATRTADARAHAKCMLRFFGLESPGVALATNDELILHPLIGGVRRIPLAHIVLKQETPGTGPYAWWGLRMFHLECPEEPLLVLGVADPAPWRSIFQPRPAANPALSVPDCRLSSGPVLFIR